MTRRTPLARTATAAALTLAALISLPLFAFAGDPPPTSPPASPAPTTVPPAHAPGAALFATDAGAGKNAGPQPPGAAAVVDGHVIPMSDVVALCLREAGPSAVDRLVQHYVVDRECKRRGIVVPQSEIDRRVEDLRRAIAPMTLEDGLRAHHQTRAMLEDDIRQSIERVQLVIDRVPPTKMVHCRAILVPFAPPGVPTTVIGTQQTEAQAQATAARLQKQLQAGADFANLARQHSALAQNNGGDVGVLYEGIHDVDTVLLQAALGMHRGETTTKVVRTGSGFCLIQALSTDKDHADSEDGLYAQAERTYKEMRAQFLVGQGIVDILSKSHVEYFVHD